MNKHYRDDDDAFDERGLLRDGRVYRAKLTMMDHDPTHRRRIVDASGDALGLHRPGYRVFDVDDVGDVKAEARRRYEQELCDSWRGDAASNPTKDPDLNDPDDDEDDDERPRRRRRFQKRDPFGRESGSISEEDGDRYQVRCADNDAAVRPRRSADLAMHRPGFRVTDTPPSDELQRAHDAYEHELTTAWERGAGKEDVVPDAPKASGNDATPVDDIETAYRLYAEEISQAWKGPR
jgi:hypothetical protein